MSVPFVVVTLIEVIVSERVTVPPPNNTPVVRSVPDNDPTQIFVLGVTKTYDAVYADAAADVLPTLNPVVDDAIGPAVLV